MVAQTQQNHFVSGKIAALKNRMTVALLLALHGKANAMRANSRIQRRHSCTSTGYFSRRRR